MNDHNIPSKTDLARRLREWADHCNESQRGVTVALLREAAAAVESGVETPGDVQTWRDEAIRLHKQLLEHAETCSESAYPITDRARAARAESLDDLMTLPVEVLRERYLTQKEWIHHYGHCLDGLLGAAADYTGLMPKDIRRHFEALQVKTTIGKPMHVHVWNDHVPGVDDYCVKCGFKPNQHASSEKTSLPRSIPVPDETLDRRKP